MPDENLLGGGTARLSDMKVERKPYFQQKSINQRNVDEFFDGAYLGGGITQAPKERARHHRAPLAPRMLKAEIQYSQFTSNASSSIINIIDTFKSCHGSVLLPTALSATARTSVI